VWPAIKKQLTDKSNGRKDKHRVGDERQHGKRGNLAQFLRLRRPSVRQSGCVRRYGNFLLAAAAFFGRVGGRSEQALARRLLLSSSIADPIASRQLFFWLLEGCAMP
jgi:hypothetical protein